ncbi:hypothetical protein MDA_GLEAN10018927 [Myotis davidii]|uniref:Uncharacterized protein n=1 Tax=Myotis davidii TaxID=225400 RepID=L5M0P6_MYODS|nr:hypothetical protein MDA_GLEAN10018927 [Myotis davidii]
MHWPQTLHTISRCKLGRRHQWVRAVAAALMAPHEPSEVEKPSGVIWAGSYHWQPLMVLGNQDRHQAPAIGASGSSGTGCRCEQGLHWQWVQAAALGPAVVVRGGCQPRSPLRSQGEVEKPLGGNWGWQPPLASADGAEQ